jgi:hypothetical protein
MLLLVISLILLFAVGGSYGYRSGYYGKRAMSLMGVLIVILVIFLVMNGDFGHMMYIR